MIQLVVIKHIPCTRPSIEYSEYTETNVTGPLSLISRTLSGIELNEYVTGSEISEPPKTRIKSFVIRVYVLELCKDISELIFISEIVLGFALKFDGKTNTVLLPFRP